MDTFIILFLIDLTDWQGGEYPTRMVGYICHKSRSHGSSSEDRTLPSSGETNGRRMARPLQTYFSPNYQATFISAIFLQ